MTTLLNNPIYLEEDLDVLDPTIENATDETNIGTILSVGDGIARVAGLLDVKAGEMVYIFGEKKKFGD